MPKINLQCTDEQFHELNKACFDARDGSVQIKVSKEALKKLLFDHSKLVEKFRNDLSGYV